ncbi:hypothetical protein GCM10027275_42450 [Rhabdobacter roseus]|uniref:Uncharacterized protein n=1 Tax=Rhabdobacter roseus TaxID=1655419 RepID=A0A840TSE4_9BACT|nr:hypothetical protein [Rhabdobacter roseus]MBB5286224.1 hypothetical protein [Rhabdobacter roseus]
MDTTVLVNKLKHLFLEARNKGLLVDGIGLAPAYGGMVSHSYVLGVSAPSLATKDPYDKMDIILDLLFDKLPENERKMIDRVRVYDTLSELKQHANSDFDNYGSDWQERTMTKNVELFEMAQ